MADQSIACDSNCPHCKGKGYVLEWRSHWGGTKSFPMLAEKISRRLPCPATQQK